MSQLNAVPSEESTVVLSMDETGMIHERHVSRYNFKRPNKVTKDHYRALQLVHDTFARQLSTILSTTLRAVSPVTVVSIDQETYDEFITPLPNPTFLAIFNAEPLPGQAMFHWPQDLSMEIVDRLLGGHGKAKIPKRALSEIEIDVFRGLLDRAMRELTYAFESFMNVSARITSHETNPQFAQLLGLSEMVVSATYHVGIGDGKWPIKLTFPYSMIHPALEAFTESKREVAQSEKELRVVRQRLREAVEDASMELTVEFNTVTLGASDILDLRVGDILPLEHRVKDPLTIKIGNQPCFEGLPGKMGARLSCMIITDAENNPFLKRPTEILQLNDPSEQLHAGQLESHQVHDSMLQSPSLQTEDDNWITTPEPSRFPGDEL